MDAFRGPVEPVEPGFVQDNVGRVDPIYEKELTSRLRQGARRYETENPDIVLWIRDSLSRIDHKKLASVYQHIADRGGELNRTVEVVPPERTFVVSLQQEQEIGAHSYIARTNTFNGDHFKSLLQEHSAREAFTVLFDAICHENAHATGFVDIRKAKHGDVSLSAGYEDVVVTQTEVLAPRHLINEGIMELIGELAARMYLEEKPIELPDGSILTAEMYDAYVRDELMKGTDLSTSNDSLGAREFVYRLAEHVAKKSGGSAGDVVERLIDGFFRGGGFTSESGLSFNTSVGPDFVGELADAETRQDLERLATKYNFPELAQDIHQRMMKDLLTSPRPQAA